MTSKVPKEDVLVVRDMMLVRHAWQSLEDIVDKENLINRDEFELVCQALEKWGKAFSKRTGFEFE